MADLTNIVLGMSPEQVALELHRDIKFNEDGSKLERTWTLQTYSESLRTVRDKLK
jgi:hypothetical protein